MLPEIDFLPASYRQKLQCRRRKTWRASVVVAFLALAALGTFAQYRLRARLEMSRAEMQSHAEKMTSQLESADALYRRIRELDAQANLVTRLRVRAATTHILTDVTKTLPQFVSLHEFRVNVDTAAAKAEDKPRGNKAQTAAPVLSPSAADLAQLEELEGRSTQTVSLAGFAPDDVAVSKYLAALERTGDFEQVQLLFTDNHTYRGHELRSFGIRLRVRKPKLGMAPAESPAAATAEGNAAKRPTQPRAAERNASSVESASSERAERRES